MRDFHVFDGGGEHLGSFPTFTAAHDWAHLQAALGGVTTPVAVEDRVRRVTRQISRDACETVIWQIPGVTPASRAAADDCQPDLRADPAASLRTSHERSPDAYTHQQQQPPKPRTPLDAEIIGGGQRDR